jgi:hypothetical protein
MQINVRICEICKTERRNDTEKDAYLAFGTFELGFEGTHWDRRYNVTKSNLGCQRQSSTKRDRTAL